MECYLGVKSGKLMYFFRNLLFDSGTGLRQTLHIVMMTKEGSTEIVIFMTPGPGILLLRLGHIINKVKMHYFLNFFFISTPRHSLDN